MGKIDSQTQDISSEEATFGYLVSQHPFTRRIGDRVPGEIKVRTKGIGSSGSSG